MSKNLFKEVLPITRENAETAFQSGIPDEICNALVRITFNESDWHWIQEKCLDFINSSDISVRAVAITCLGHIARIHGKLEMDKIMPVLESLRNDADVSGTVEDAFEDILTFLR